jgi:protein associated with RNAse G/E
MAKQRMKAKVLDLSELERDEDYAENVEEMLNDALKEIGEYYIHDVRPLGKGLVAILYFTQKRSD